MFRIDHRQLEKFATTWAEETLQLAAWNPTAGNEDDIGPFIRAMQGLGEPVPGGNPVSRPGDAALLFVFSDGANGGSFQWQVYLPDQSMYLGSLHKAMRTVVTGGAVGIEALIELAEDAVRHGNELLSKLDAFKSPIVAGVHVVTRLGHRGRVTKVSANAEEAGLDPAWLNAQRPPLTQAQRAGAWVHIDVLSGGAIVAPMDAVEVDGS